jgi:hypothetical protein
MKYATFKGIKTHAKQAVSGDIGNDIWFKEYEVTACVGKYRQYWKYVDEKPILPPGYEPETEWHAAWKSLVQDEYSEVVCGDNREHRADIKTDKHVIEIQKSRIDGRDVIARNKFYQKLTGTRVVWIVNIEKPWKEKKLKTELVKGQEDQRFTIEWLDKWSWIEEIAGPNDTFLFLDFNPKSDKFIYMWKNKNNRYGKWASKKLFFKTYLSNIAKEEFVNGKEDFMNVFNFL